MKIVIRSFNPCFSGYGIQTINLVCCKIYCRKFQSLFFWIWNSDFNSFKPFTLLSEVSILVFLDMEFRLHYWQGLQALQSSFNPCFSGYGIQTPFSLFARVQYTCFNPCFSGYGIQTPEPVIRCGRNTGFNPCFSGYGIQTGTGRNFQRVWWKFQSLFFWIWNSDRSGDQTLPVTQDVSILVFLDMEFRLHYPNADYHESF